MLWDFYERIGAAIALNDISKLSNEDLGYIAADLSRINAELDFLMRPKPKKKTAAKKRAKK